MYLKLYVYFFSIAFEQTKIALETYLYEKLFF